MGKDKTYLYLLLAGGAGLVLYYAYSQGYFSSSSQTSSTAPASTATGTALPTQTTSPAPALSGGTTLPTLSDTAPSTPISNAAFSQALANILNPAAAPLSASEGNPAIVAPMASVTQENAAGTAATNYNPSYSLAQGPAGIIPSGTPLDQLSGAQIGTLSTWNQQVLAGLTQLGQAGQVQIKQSSAGTSLVHG